MQTLVHLVLLFFAYSIVGWIIEVTGKYFQYHRFINRGFFTGPWLPIYGSGCVLITLAVESLAGVEYGIGTTFAISFVLCGVLEYMVSFVMEKRFHARWWDYSQKPMNLHGRIWIGNLILFGLGGVLVVHLANPVLLKLFGMISVLGQEILAGGLAVLFVADYIISHFVLKLVKRSVESSEADNTEEISREVRMILRDRSVFARRFADAYPEVIYRTERVKARIEEIRAESERIRREAEVRVSELNQQLAANLEPTLSVKNTILEKQGELIDLIYEEQNATEKARALKAEIDEKNALLKKRRERLNVLPSLTERET